jgi:hypothetical protein
MSNNLLKIIEEMRKFDPQLEAQAISVFFYVADKGGKDGVAENFEDPMERRRKLVRLTAKGRRVHNTLLEWVK